MTPARATLLRRIAGALGTVGLIAWVLWWADALAYLDLALAGKTWLEYPAFGADFWSQSEYAARLWWSGGDPYASRGHLFHYPPIVIRFFLWVNWFSQSTSLRIWVTFLAALVAWASAVAVQTRRRLGLWQPPITLAILAVLASFPVLFQLERSNFDLITLFVLLLALPLFAKESPGWDFAAGCLLSVGPWVKLYPGLMGLGLVALRRKWAVVGFAVAGVAIFALAPRETVSSFQVLGIQMARIRAYADVGPYPIWSHSLSLAWLQLVHGVRKEPFATWLHRIPESVAAGGMVVSAIGTVCYLLYRRRTNGTLLYPLLLWICATASCAPIIANDYSLAFYPLAAVACLSLGDPWPVKIAVLASLLWLQPFRLPLPGELVLVAKISGVFALGWSLVRRASELQRRDASARP